MSDQESAERRAQGAEAGDVSPAPRALRPGPSRAKLILLALLAVLAIHDLAVPPGRGFAARGALFAIDGYRARVSPHLRGRVHCRFQPTCSYYGRESIRKYGFIRGSARTAWRIAKCGPWTKAGTLDPP